MTTSAKPTIEPVARTDKDCGAADAVTIQIAAGVARLTIGAGMRRNALGIAGWTRLRRLADELAGRREVRLVLLRGAGSTFSAGFDIREWRDASSPDVDASFAAMEAALQAVENIEVPTVAVLEGVAAGAGCELALACDLRLMASSACLGMPILRLGILPSPQFTQRLAALAGPARARELLFTGRLLDAGQAERYALATEVVDDRDLDARVAELVTAITSQPRSGLVATKAASGLELARLRDAHERPSWSFSDPREFPQRVAAFLAAAAEKEPAPDTRFPITHAVDTRPSSRTTSEATSRTPACDTATHRSSWPTGST